MTTPPLAHYRRALETYIDAKDNTRAERIAEAFAQRIKNPCRVATMQGFFGLPEKPEAIYFAALTM
ncbi:hypothetical protein [Paraburkholderia sp. SIMBA_030]|uniref:hypothetical protein n=1 Tax=Paraburkholderia sp. SIMBA_030 TaxID=3085773 RepID=UPI0039788A5F